jgi:hypothetical protein
MSEPSTTPSRPLLRSPVVGAVLLAILIATIVLGAYLDWRWWHPASGIVVTMAAGAMLVLGGIGAALRWRRLHPVAAGAVVAGVGLLLGQALGPEREAPILAEGTVTIVLERPEGAAEVTGPTTCNHTASGANYLVSTDSNLRLELGDQPDEERDFVMASLSHGDMWEHGAEARPDRIGLTIIVADAGPFTDVDVPTEVVMASDASSTLSLEGTQESGRLAFSGLVPDPDRPDARQDPIELAGTLAWECEPVSFE